jgi:hypothetical protein
MDPDWYSASKMLDPDQDSMNPDPKHCFSVTVKHLKFGNGH